MIKRFKPVDLEECLMGLPIENWIFVDETQFNNDAVGEMLRPKMMISHLEELKGITYDGIHKIRAFTRLNDIYASDLPESFKTVLKNSVDQGNKEFNTFGCYFINLKYDDFLMPYLVAADASFIIKGYMKERILDMKSYHLSSKKMNFRYNEIPFEIQLKHNEFTHLDYGKVSTVLDGKELLFSYFIGAVIENGYYIDYKMAIQLPSKRIIRSEKLEQTLIGCPIDLDEYFKNELRKLFHNYTGVHRIANYGAKDMEQIFEEVFWKIVCKFAERSHCDES